MNISSGREYMKLRYKKYRRLARRDLARPDFTIAVGSVPSESTQLLCSVAPRLKGEIENNIANELDDLRRHGKAAASAKSSWERNELQLKRIKWPNYILMCECWNVNASFSFLLFDVSLQENIRFCVQEKINEIPTVYQLYYYTECRQREWLECFRYLENF